MKYFPYENYTLTTDLSIDEIKDKLNYVVEPKKAFRFSLFKANAIKPYEGEIATDSFLINRILSYRNSWNPIISGKIKKNVIGTSIQIKMTIQLFVSIPMFFFIGIFALDFIILFCKSVFSGQFPRTSTGPFLVISLLYVIMTIAFKYESLKSKKFLSDLFEININKSDLQNN